MAAGPSTPIVSMTWTLTLVLGRLRVCGRVCVGVWVFVRVRVCPLCVCGVVALAARLAVEVVIGSGCG